MSEENIINVLKNQIEFFTSQTWHHLKEYGIESKYYKESFYRMSGLHDFLLLINELNKTD